MKVIQRIKRICDLNKILDDGRQHTFIVQLAGGLLYSRKVIHRMRSGKYSILNCIDDTRQVISAQEIRAGKVTNIGKAMRNGAFALV